MPVSEDVVDLGDGHRIRIAVWEPDLELNSSLAHLAGQFPAKITGIVTHELPGGGECSGAITFDVPLAREFFKGPFWTVESWEPLTLSPSLLCHCGDHGFILDGRWVRA
jgi:hypothetical protein